MTVGGQSKSRMAGCSCDSEGPRVGKGGKAAELRRPTGAGTAPGLQVRLHI